MPWHYTPASLGLDLTPALRPHPSGSVSSDWTLRQPPTNLPPGKSGRLLLNGKHDVYFPPETSSQPMFDLLGTPAQDKDLILFEIDHIPPRAEYIKEIYAWLDKYLGPVER